MSSMSLRQSNDLINIVGNIYQQFVGYVNIGAAHPIISITWLFINVYVYVCWSEDFASDLCMRCMCMNRLLSQFLCFRFRKSDMHLTRKKNANKELDFSFGIVFYMCNVCMCNRENTKHLLLINVLIESIDGIGISFKFKH